MNITITKTPEQQAYERGYERGEQDYWASIDLGIVPVPNEYPLSGEWAGESIPELLGDLLSEAEWCESIYEAYERGYEEGWSDTRWYDTVD